MMTRKPYLSDVSDDEWAFVSPYLTATEGVPQQTYSLREIFNGLRWLARNRARWHMMPSDLPPWYTVYQHIQHWRKIGVFTVLSHDLRMFLRENDQTQQHHSTLFGREMRQSCPEHGATRSKRRNGRKLHSADDSVGPMPALRDTSIGIPQYGQGFEPAKQKQKVTYEVIASATNAQNDTRAPSPQDPEIQSIRESYGIRMEVIKLPTANRGFMLLPRRWIMERKRCGMARFRRLARDYERLPETIAGLEAV